MYGVEFSKSLAAIPNLEDFAERERGDEIGRNQLQFSHPIFTLLLFYWHVVVVDHAQFLILIL